MTMERMPTTEPRLCLGIKSSAPHRFDNFGVAKDNLDIDSSVAKLEVVSLLSPALLIFHLVSMAFRPHLYSHDGAFLAIASANSIHPGSPILPDSQLTACQSSSAFQPDALAITSPSSRDAGTPTVTRAMSSNGWAAKEDWARHRALIKRLYLDEKKPLTEVMRLMESEHGFKAT